VEVRNAEATKSQRWVGMEVDKGVNPMESKRLVELGDVTEHDEQFAPVSVTHQSTREFAKHGRNHH